MGRDARKSPETQGRPPCSRTSGGGVLRQGIVLVVGCLLLSALPALGRQKIDERPDLELTARIQAFVDPFDGRVGVYAHHFPSGRTVAIDADSLFPTASMIKVPLLVALFDKIERGEIGYHDRWVYHDSLLYPGEDLLGSFASGQSIEVSKVALLMITTSDNTASLWVQQQVGTGTAVNAWLEEHGFASTRVNSRTPGREPARARYGWGQTTPREMARLLAAIRQGEAVSPAASEEMYRNLTRIYWDDEALSQIPPTIQVASKQGAVNASKSEVALVNAPGGDYVFCVITDGQADQRWEPDNAGYVLIRTVSRLLWETFEPESTWRPAPGMDRYW